MLEDFSNKLFTPIMKSITSTIIKPQNKIRYKRYKPIDNIKGFIVNIHDAINFDVDLDISDEVKNRYLDVITNSYGYRTVSYGPSDKPFPITLSSPHSGTTYRCRLRGIAINQNNTIQNTHKANIISDKIKKLIDIADGNIICSISDVDIYRRLLITITIITSYGRINLTDYLLFLMKDEEEPIYHQYKPYNSYP